MHTQMYQKSHYPVCCPGIQIIKKMANTIVQLRAELKSEGPGLLPRGNSMPITNAEL
jgi:hypothetical protein